MCCVLGIDAAWTVNQPSGVALATYTGGKWRLVTLASSYDQFLTQSSGIQVYRKPIGSLPDAKSLINESVKLAKSEISLIAIDLPMSKTPITGRRVSDDAVSRFYGSRHCGTHSPSASRPGSLSDSLVRQFDELGFPLMTARIRLPCLIEVYPHPALVELASATSRLPYKVSKTRKYWPNLSLKDRRSMLVLEWQAIVDFLDEKICGVKEHFLPFEKDLTLSEMKAIEDRLDATVCAWVGICAVESKAIPYGDNESAIWIPSNPK